MESSSKLGLAEAVVLLTMSSMARIFLTFPRALVEISGPAAWLSSITGMALAILQVYLFYLILKPNPGRNIVDMANEKLGNIAGTAVNIIFASFFIAEAALFTRTFSEALIISALPSTPISVLMTGYITMAILGAYIGLEALARSARVTYPFVLFGIALLLLGLIPKWDFQQVFPILGNGPVNVFIKGGHLAGAVTEILLAAVIVKSFHGPEMFFKITSRALLMGFAFLTVLLFVMVITFGWNTAQENTLPFYRLATLIYLGRFFQRVESVFIIIWGFIGMIKVALTLYAAALTLAGTLRLPDHRPLLWPLAVIIYTCSILPHDMPTAVRLESVLIRGVSWLPAVALPLIILIVSRVRKRSGPDESG
ncbi:MAG: spore germination protein [Firmicutes bacterium]|nr:spore germination protein [Bacillota bacterium]MCL5057949.1 spore germination protein [Actinomycetota bacterium]